MRAFYAVLFSALAFNAAAAGITEASLNGVYNFYSQVASSLAPSNVPFAGIYEQPLTLGSRGYEEHSFGYYPCVVFADAQFYFQVTKEPEPKLISLYNYQLDYYISTNNILHVSIPAWTPQVAIDKSKDILKALHIPAAGMAVKRVCRTRIDCSVWRVHWERRHQGIPYDPFVDQLDQRVEVDISERHGFVGYYGRYDFPVPKRMDVLVRQEDAIAKASKAVPLIQRSPYYLQCRLPGFVVSGLRSAELLVAAPNWLLDPKRAIWLRDKPPDETRLCWVITFTSVYTGKTEPNAIPLAPAFLVYIDAATGEIVGANFT